MREPGSGGERATTEVRLLMFPAWRLITARKGPPRALPWKLLGLTSEEQYRFPLNSRLVEPDKPLPRFLAWAEGNSEPSRRQRVLFALEEGGGESSRPQGRLFSHWPDRYEPDTRQLELFEEWFEPAQHDRSTQRVAETTEPTLAKPRVYRPPGSRLSTLSEAVFSKRFLDDVVTPTLTDLREEYWQALHQGRPGKARWVLVRGYWSFWSAVVAQVPVSFTRLMVQLWKISGPGG